MKKSENKNKVTTTTSGPGPTLEVWSGRTKLPQEIIGHVRYDIQTPVRLQDLELEVQSLRQNIQQINRSRIRTSLMVLALVIIWLTSRC